MVQLSDVSDTRLGKTLPRGGGADDDGHPYLRNVNVQWGKIQTTGLNQMHFSDVEREQLTLHTGDILVCEGGEVGRLALVPRNLDGIYYQNALHRVRVNESIAMPEYVAFSLEHFVRDGGLDGLKTQVTIAHLNQSKLRALPLALPPLPEQRRIVDLIGALDESIAAAESTLKELLAMMEQVRAVLPSGDHLTLGSALVAIESGRSTKPVSGDGVAVNMLTLAAIRPAEFFPSEIKDVGAAKLPEKALLQEGDLLITRSNTPDRVGYVALARDVKGSTYLPDLVWRLVPNEELVTKEYLEQTLSSRMMRSKIAGAASGTSQSMRKINKSSFSALTIPVPPLRDQERYVAPLRAMSDTKSSLDQGLFELQTLRSNMLTALLSGEHKIPESYDAVMEVSV